MTKDTVRFGRILHVLLAISLLTCASPAQQPKAPPPSRVTIRDVAFQSAALGRGMRYRILLPTGYDHTMRRYPVLYLLHGLTGSYVDWDTKTHLRDYTAPLDLIIVMPDAGDSWYTNSAGDPQEKFEDYIAHDLLAEIDKNYRTIATRHGRAIAGLSMGGYGALKFALKYPDLFAFAGSFSGAIVVAHDASYVIRFGARYTQQAQTIFGPAGAANRVQNDVFELAAKADPARLPYLYITCGANDGLWTTNREFVGLLHAQKILYEFRESPGGHDWAYWDEQLLLMLNALGKHVELRPMPLLAPMASPARPRPLMP